jgi:tetrapyrrole methylase family protein/MazG family protein
MTYTDHKLHSLFSTISKLRSETGCPWDKKQTSLTLVKYLRSEMDELIAALQNQDSANTCEELGDLLYLLLMVCDICNHDDQFTFDDVVTGVTEKLIRRHPHVFAGTPYKDEAELAEQWKKIKAAEKKKYSV